MNGIQQLAARGGQPKSTVTQQLMDALATQKAVSDKQKAMKEMQQEMADKGMQPQQGGLPTVAQQREQELVGLNRQEMVNQVMPTLQRKMMQQQQAMQQAPQQAAQAKQGLAQLQQQQAMQNQQGQQRQQRFRTGGIVNTFNVGGAVPPTQGSAPVPPERQKQLDELNQFDKNIFSALTPDYAPPEMLEEARALGINFSDYVAREVAERKIAEAKQQGVTPKTAAPEVYDERAIQDEQGLGSEDKEKAPTLEEIERLVGGSGSSGNRTGSGQSASVSSPLATLEQMQERIKEERDSLQAPEEVDTAAQAAQVYNTFSNETISPEEARESEKKAMEYHKEIMGYDESMSEFDNMLETARKRYEAAKDPSTRKWSKISAFLRGFGGTTDIGSGFARASGAMAQQRAMNQARENAAFENMYKVFQDRNASKQEQLNAAAAYGQNVYNTLMDERKSAITDMRTMRNTGEQIQQSKMSNFQSQKQTLFVEELDAMKQKIKVALANNEIRSKEDLAVLGMDNDNRAMLFDMLIKMPEVVKKVDEMVAETHGPLLLQASQDSAKGRAAARKLNVLRFKTMQEYGIPSLVDLINAGISDSGDPRIQAMGAAIDPVALLSEQEPESVSKYVEN